MGTLTKAGLVEKIYANHPTLTKSQAVQAVELFLSLAKSSLIQGDDLLLSGFGKFNVRDKKPRRGRNPQTGDTLILDARRVVTFRPSDLLRDKVNKG
jgi:integration host factor subunit alpha